MTRHHCIDELEPIAIQRTATGHINYPHYLARAHRLRANAFTETFAWLSALSGRLVDRAATTAVRLVQQAGTDRFL